MLRVTSIALGVGLILALGSWGCGSKSRLTTDEAYFELQPVQPLSESEGIKIPENLIVKVENVADLGSSYKNWLELYVNDHLIEPDEGSSNYQNVYNYRLKLQPGIYMVKALYHASTGWGEKAYAVVARQSIKILPDTRTMLHADIRKDWRGTPISDQIYFDVKYEPLGAKVVEGLPEQPVLVEVDEDEIGPPKELAAKPISDVEHIRPAPLVVETNLIGLQINTVPSGAEVIIDDRFVGQTPLRISVDRFSSHIVQISAKGHKEVMKLLDFRQFGGEDVIYFMERLEPESH